MLTHETIDKIIEEDTNNQSKDPFFSIDYNDLDKIFIVQMGAKDVLKKSKFSDFFNDIECIIFN